MSAPSTARPVPVGESSRIKLRQDQEEHLRRLLAYSHEYHVAQRWRRTRAAGTIALALAAPWIALAVPSTTDALAAVSAGWLLLARTLLAWGEQRAIKVAVDMQECYDTRLFHLTWNRSLAGREPAPEDIAAAARHIKDRRPYLDWYSIDLRDVPWPGDALLCQRQSMIWSRRDHRAYSVLLLVTCGIVLLGGLTTAALLHLEVGEYLIKIFLPTSPALLDTAELGRANWEHADARQQAEHDTDDLWQRYRHDPGHVPVDECRRVQDAAYMLRRAAPRVPNLFYKVRKAVSTHVTAAGTDALLNDAHD